MFPFGKIRHVVARFHSLVSLSAGGAGLAGVAEGVGQGCQVPQAVSRRPRAKTPSPSAIHRASQLSYQCWSRYCPGPFGRTEKNWQIRQEAGQVRRQGTVPGGQGAAKKSRVGSTLPFSSKAPSRMNSARSSPILASIARSKGESSFVDLMGASVDLRPKLRGEANQKLRAPWPIRKPIFAAIGFTPAPTESLPSNCSWRAKRGRRSWTKVWLSSRLNAARSMR